MKKIHYILIAVLASLAFVGGFEIVNPSTITGGNVLVDHAGGTNYVSLDSLLFGSGTVDGNGLLTAANEEGTIAVYNVNMSTATNRLEWDGAGNVSTRMATDSTGTSWFNVAGMVVAATQQKAWLGKSDNISAYAEFDTSGIGKIQTTMLILQGKPILSNQGFMASFPDGDASDTLKWGMPAILKDTYYIEWPDTAQADNSAMITNADGSSSWKVVHSGEWVPTFSFSNNDTLLTLYYASYTRIDNIVRFSLKINVAFESSASTWINSAIRFSPPFALTGTPVSDVSTACAMRGNTVTLGEMISPNFDVGFLSGNITQTQHTVRDVNNFVFPFNRFYVQIEGSYKINN